MQLDQTHVHIVFSLPIFFWRHSPALSTLMCTNASSTAAVVFIVLYKRRKSLYAPLDPCGGWCPTFGRVQRGLCCRSVSFLFPPLCVCCLGNSIGTLFSHPVCYLSCSNFFYPLLAGLDYSSGKRDNSTASCSSSTTLLIVHSASKYIKMLIKKYYEF